MSVVHQEFNGKIVKSVHVSSSVVQKEQQLLIVTQDIHHCANPLFTRNASAHRLALSHCQYPRSLVARSSERRKDAAPETCGCYTNRSGFVIPVQVGAYTLHMFC
jgi:hypothetical protein